DLYYRLRGVVLEVPALRQRVADLPHVATAILDRIAAARGIAPKRLSAAALEGLCRHPWPGNVRELENALLAAALFAEGNVIDLDDLTTNIGGLRGLSVPPLPPLTPTSPEVTFMGPQAAVTPTDLSPVLVGGDPATGVSEPTTLPTPALGTARMDPGTDGALDVAAMTQPSKFAQAG